MISNDQELQAALERVRQFQLQIANLRRVERNPENYLLSASGYLAELDRMALRAGSAVPEASYPVPAALKRPKLLPNDARLGRHPGTKMNGVGRVNALNAHRSRASTQRAPLADLVDMESHDHHRD